MSKPKLPVPHEDVEQRNLFIWAAYRMGMYPELRWMYHIPNGGSRPKVEAAKLVSQGVKAGVSDIFLPAARGPYHGLFVEMKRLKGGKIEPEQKDFMEAMNAAGYRAVLCKGWEEATVVIEAYLNIGKKFHPCQTCGTQVPCPNGCERQRAYDKMTEGNDNA